MLTRIIAATLLAVTVTSCATVETENATWLVVGGSKADGMITLGIDVPPKNGVTETIIHWDAKQANSEADKRCKNWGYAGAEAFNDKFPVHKVCHPQGISPCWSKTYRIVYQCIGEK